MKVLAIRFVTVTAEAEALSDFFGALNLPRLNLADFGIDTETFPGAIFVAGDSWIEVWKPGQEMPAGIMLQIVVDDADAFAANARTNRLDPQGPMDAHGERIYFVKAPSGLQVSFQSKMSDGAA